MNVREGKGCVKEHMLCTTYLQMGEKYYGRKEHKIKYKEVFD